MAEGMGCSAPCSQASETLVLRSFPKIREGENVRGNVRGGEGFGLP